MTRKTDISIDTKKKEIHGYHAFAENSGWTATYDNMLNRINDGEQDDCFRHMIEIIKMKKSTGKILDCASGIGWVSHIFTKYDYDVVNIEINPSPLCGIGFLRIHRNKISFENIQGDCENLPIRTGKFDVVFCYQALHHMTNINKMVYEMARCAKKGGLVIAGGEPIKPFFSDEKRFIDENPTSRFGTNEHAYPYYQYINAFKNAGLSEIKVIPFSNFNTRSQNIVKKFVVQSINKCIIFIDMVPIIGKPLLNFIRLNFSSAGTDIIIYGFK